jgi:DNA-binding LytR/AlgR family response regulator
MRVIIIEDETPALIRLQKLIRKVEPEADIIGTADSIESAVELFAKNPQAELAFMDIELADGRSFEIFNRIQIKCPVIFTTAYDEFALQAFKVNSIDYLLKPVDADLLKQAIEKFKQLYNSKTHLPDLTELLKQLQKPTTAAVKNRFLLKVGTKWISVPLSDISCFYAADKSVYMLTMQKQKYVMDESLDQLLPQLPEIDFFQLNRGCIASYKSIQSVHSYFNGKLKVELSPSPDEEVTVSRERAPEFKKWLDR